MTRIRAAAVIAALAASLAVPAGAAAQANGDDCSYTTTGGSEAGVQAGAGGMTGDGGTTAVGVCLNAPTPENTVQGGSLEIGVSGTEVYGVIDGDNQNSDPIDGYAGLSNYENGDFTDPSCADGPDEGDDASTNSGGCFGVDGGPWVAVPLIICGNSSGSQWWSTKRDGCSNP